MKTGRITVALLTPLLCAAMSCNIQSDKPASGPVFLNQGWSQEQREEFYHKSQGTRLIPLEWLLALKQNGSQERFLAPSYVTSMGFIPDSAHKFNEHGLPVGFAVAQLPGAEDPSRKIPWVGYTCAACHTSRIIAGGKTVQIDGAPSMHNNLLFVGAMLAALKETAEDPRRLHEFTSEVHHSQSPGDEEKEAIRNQIRDFLKKLDRLGGRQAVERARKECRDPMMKRRFEDPTFSVFPGNTWGFGRLDAVGRASNTLFAPMHPCNLDAADAPVSIPKVWYAWKYDWVQWNAFVENPLARNLAQAVALGADPGLKDRKARTLDLKALIWLEDQLHRLEPPSWEKVFGPVDKDLVEEGRALYREGRPSRPVKTGLCKHCHAPKPRKLACDGEALLPMALVQIEETKDDAEAIGTDKSTMENYILRTKLPPPKYKLFSHLPNPFEPARAMSEITSKALEIGFAAENIAKSEQDRVQRCRKNEWLSQPGYKAPTHEGVWATAPYLHNGSIPNLYLLLSPQEERDRQAEVFCVGHDLTYDPVNVGFVLTDRCPGPSAFPDLYKFDTTLRGNGNTGHEFRNAPGCEKLEGGPPEKGILGCELSEHERKALVEYLKTL